MMKNPLLAAFLGAIIFGGVGFFAGTKYQSTKIAANRTSYAGFMNQNGQRQTVNRNGMRPVTGAVTSIDTNSMTVRLQDGSSKLVILSGTTRFVKTNDVSLSDITTGTQVGVFGSTNADGSVTALNVQINPQLNARPGISGTPRP